MFRLKKINNIINHTGIYYESVESPKFCFFTKFYSRYICNFAVFIGCLLRPIVTDIFRLGLFWCTFSATRMVCLFNNLIINNNSIRVQPFQRRFQKQNVYLFQYKFIFTLFHTSCGFITIFRFIDLLRITGLEINEFSTLRLSWFSTPTDWILNFR